MSIMYDSGYHLTNKLRYVITANILKAVIIRGAFPSKQLL